jgi:translocation and assembly module TamB
MTRRRKVLVAFLVCLLALGGCVGAGFWWLTGERFNAWAKAFIIAELRKNNDIEAEIDALDLRVFALTADLRGVRLRLPNEPTPFLSVDHAFAKARLNNLWKQDVSLESVTLERPDVRLAFDEKGALNLARIRLPKRKPKKPGDASPLVDPALRGGKVAVADGTIRIAEKTYDVTSDLSDLTVSASLDDGGAVNAVLSFGEGKFSYGEKNGERRTLDGFKLETRATIYNDRADVPSLVISTPYGETTIAANVRWMTPDGPSPTPVADKPEPGAVRPKTRAPRMSPTPLFSYEGNLFSAIDLGRACQDFLPSVPLKGPAKLRAKVSGTDFDCRIEGNLEPLNVSLFGATATNLRFDYLIDAPFERFPGEVESAVKVGSIRYDRFTVEDLSARLKITPELATVEPFDARLLNGSVAGRAQIAYRNGSRGASSAEITLNNLDLQTIAGVAEVPNRGVVGKFNADAKLAWTGTAVKDATGTAAVKFAGEAQAATVRVAPDKPPVSLPPIPLSGEATADVAPGAAKVTKLAVKLGRGSLDATGGYALASGRLEADARYETPDLTEAQDLAARVGLPAPPLTAQAADDVIVRLAGTGDFAGTVSGTPDALAASGTVRVAEIRVNEQVAGEFSAEFAASPAVVTVKRATLSQPAGGRLVADFASGVQTDQPTDLRVTLDRIRLDLVGGVLSKVAGGQAQSFAKTLADAGGEASGEVTLTDLPSVKTLMKNVAEAKSQNRDDKRGVLDALKLDSLKSVRGQGALTLARVKTAYGEMQDGKFAFRVREDGFALEEATVQLPAGVISATASYATETKKYDVQAKSAKLDLGKLNLRPANADYPVSGALAFSFSSSSNLDALLKQRFAFTFDATSETVGVGKYRFAKVAAKAEGLGKEGRVFLTTHYNNQPYEAKATIDFEDEELPISSEFRFNQTPLAPLFALAGVGPQNVTGDVTGVAKISGPLYPADGDEYTLSKLKLTGDFPALRLAIPVGEVGEARDYAVVNDGPIKFTANLNEIKFDQCKLKGRMKDDASDTTALEVGGRIATGGNSTLNATGQIDLALLRGFSKRVFSSGTATIKASVAGRIEDPRLTGYADIDGLNLRITDFPVALENGGGRILFNLNRAQIDTFTADSGGGKVEVTGGAVFDKLTDPHWRFGVRADNVRVKYPQELRSLADANLVLQGNTKVQVLSGAVKVKRAEYTTNTDFVTLLQSQVLQLGSLSTVSTSLQTAGSPGAYTTLDIKVDAPDSVFIRNNVADIVGSASLHLRGPLGAPDISGRILITRGQLDFRGDRFQLTRGVVTIPDTPTSDTFFDLQAESIIQGYRVIIGFTGTPQSFTPILRSEPSLPQASVLSLLATGSLNSNINALATQQPAANLPATGQQAGVSAATTLISQLLTERIEQQTGRLFGINRFQIDPLIAGQGSDPTARLTIGRRITRDLSITYSLNVATAQEQIVLVEYRLKNNISLVGVRSQDGRFGFDLRFTKRF